VNRTNDLITKEEKLWQKGESGNEGDEGATVKKQRKRELEQAATAAKTQIAAAGIELKAVREGIRQEELEHAATAGSSTEQRWLVIGSDWDAGKSRWGRMAGHWSCPGDAWSRRLLLAEKELLSVQERLELERSAKLEQAAVLDPKQLKKRGAQERKERQKSVSMLKKELEQCNRSRNQRAKALRGLEEGLRRYEKVKAEQIRETYNDYPY